MMRLLTAFLLAVGMVMISPVPNNTAVANSHCGYWDCRPGDPDFTDAEVCVWVSTPCRPEPPPPPPPPPPERPQPPDAPSHTPSLPNCDDQYVCSSDNV